MASLLDDTGSWHNKYHFQDLEIGESMEVCGIEQNIRSAASMYGTRYGIWLQCSRIDDGYVKVTRILDPIRQRKKQLSKHEQLVERMDAIATLLRLILEKLKDLNSGHDQIRSHQNSTSISDPVEGDSYDGK